MLTGYISRLQINNVKLISDWSAGNQTSFLINSNGSVKEYNISTSAIIIINNSVQLSFIFWIL